MYMSHLLCSALVIMTTRPLHMSRVGQLSSMPWVCTLGTGYFTLFRCILQCVLVICCRWTVMNRDEPGWAGKSLVHIVPVNSPCESRYTAPVSPGLDVGDNCSDAGTLRTRFTVSCPFTTVSPLDLRWRDRSSQKSYGDVLISPGIRRHWVGSRSILVNYVCLKTRTTGTTSRWSPVKHGLSCFNAVLPDVATVVVAAVPGVQTEYRESVD